MRNSRLAALVIAAAFFATPGEAARNVNCPQAGAPVKAGENLAFPYQGPLVAVEMRTAGDGDQKGQATIFCVRTVGTVSVAGGRCSVLAGPGGRVTTRQEATTEILTCTLLGGTAQTNDHACIVSCD